MNLKPNQITLFKNSRKKEEKHPDMNGEVNCTCPHCKRSFSLEVTLWGKLTKNNVPYLNGTVRDPGDNQHWKRQQETQAVADEVKAKPIEVQADDLPF